MTDWSLYPMNDAVRWPLTQPVLGILGLAPMATVDFYQRFSARQVKKDWDHPRVLIDSNPKIPSRGRFFDLGETDPVPYIRKGIEGLIEAGADIVAIPCNTAHILYDKYAADLGGKVPNIIELTSLATSDFLKQNKHKKALVCASSSVIKSEMYDRQLDRLHIETCNVKDQNLITECIESIKQNKETELYGKKFAEYLNKTAKQDDIGAVIMGCTELSVIIHKRIAQINDFIHVVDSNQALADYCYSVITEFR